MAAVLIEHAGTSGVATITLNRPANLNALDTEIASGLLDALDAISQTSARVVILTANGARSGASAMKKQCAHSLTAAPRAPVCEMAMRAPRTLADCPRFDPRRADA